MTRLKRLPADLAQLLLLALPVLAVVGGFAVAAAGLYLLAGLAVTLLVAGVVVCVAGMVVDLG